MTSKKHREQCDFMCKYLTNYGVECYSFDSLNDFFLEVSENRHCADLYIADYTCYNHIVRNIYMYYIKSCKCYTPLIFSNDPFSYLDDQVSYWNKILKMVFNESLYEPPKYKNLLYLVSNALKYYKKEEQKKLENQNVEIKQELPLHLNIEKPGLNVELAKQLKASSFLIYEEMLKNYGHVVPVETMKIIVKKNEKIPSDSTINNAISTIRKAIQNTPDCKLNILKSENGYKLIRYDL